MRVKKLIIKECIKRMRTYNPKKYIGRTVRRDVILRDMQCVYYNRQISYCTGGSARGNASWRAYDSDGKPFHFDHKTPFSKGGRSDSGNVVLACQKCNLSKGTALL